MSDRYDQVGLPVQGFLTTGVVWLLYVLFDLLSFAFNHLKEWLVRECISFDISHIVCTALAD